MRGLISIGMMPKLQSGFDFHIHNVWQIVYYFEGTGTATIGDTDIPFAPGTILCFPPEAHHREVSSEGFRDYYFEVEAFSNRFDGIPCFHDNDNLDFLNIVNQIYKLYHLKQNNWKNITECLLAVLYQYMLSWSSEQRSIALVELLKNTLLSNISNSSFSLDDAMKEFSLTPNHIRKVFKKEMGKSPLHYLNEKRITYARDLLSNRSKNCYKIKEVASLCGFDDPYYFSRMFKKLTGVTPESWPL